jgi:hypothetical protein
MKIGTLLHDNDPRRKSRILKVTGHGVTTASGLHHVRAQPVGGGREVAIACRRIYADGRLRSSGFSVVETAIHPTEEDPILALVGKPIWLLRGSRGSHAGPGSFRRVRAILDGVDGHLFYASLLEDDAYATVAPFKRGECGIWHGRSFVEPMANQAEGARDD